MSSDPVDAADGSPVTSLPQTIEARLERLIDDGLLAPGERINENQLACLFGTSRGPLREATSSLQAKGYLRAVRHRGVYVRRLTLSEVLEVYDVRAALFGLAGRLACVHRGPALIDTLSRLVDDMEGAAERADIESYCLLDSQFHSTLLVATHNRLLIDEQRRFMTKTYLFSRRELMQPSTLPHSNNEHRAIVAALVAANPEQAHDAAYAHIVGARGRLLARLAHEEEVGPSGHPVV